MNTKIKDTMDKLAEGSNAVITTPEAVEKLKSQGLQFEVRPAPTLDEKFAALRKNAQDIVDSLPTLPPVENIPLAIKSLYEEIIDCILCGLNGAAITLCGNLIEFALKHAAYVKETGGYQNYDADKWDEFEQIEFGDAIGRAKRAGLLKSEFAKRLHAFREDIRNPYSHFNIRKITRNVIAGRVKKLNIETGEIEEQDIPAESDPHIQAFVKPMVDKHNVLNVYHFADEVVKMLMKRLEESLKTNV